MKLEKVFYNTAKIMVVVVFNQFFNQYIVFTQNQTDGRKKILKAFDELQTAFDYAEKANNKINLVNYLYA